MRSGTVSAVPLLSFLRCCPPNATQFGQIDLNATTVLHRRWEERFLNLVDDIGAR
jgi:hypothetical protein